MGSAVTAASVSVGPPVVRWQQFAECGEQVVVTACSGLQDGHPGRGVRHEYVQQPVRGGFSCLLREPVAFTRDVQDGLAAAGSEGDHFAQHEAESAKPKVVSQQRLAYTAHRAHCVR